MKNLGLGGRLFLIRIYSLFMTCCVVLLCCVVLQKLIWEFLMSNSAAKAGLRWGLISNKYVPLLSCWKVIFDPYLFMIYDLLCCVAKIGLGYFNISA